MKITKSQLKQIIKEEIEAVLAEREILMENYPGGADAAIAHRDYYKPTGTGGDVRDIETKKYKDY